MRSVALHQAFRRQWRAELTRLQRTAERVAAQWLSEAAEDLEISLVDDSPSLTRRDIHIYAKGRYAGSWGRRKVRRFQYIIDNNATKRGKDYSQYTNEGYTRRGGRASANSWFTRTAHAGRVFKSYADLTVMRVMPFLEADLKKRAIAALTKEVRRGG